MNDRLADLGDEVPSWAVESTGNSSSMGGGGEEIELGRMSSSPTGGTQQQQLDNTPSWFNAPDDFNSSPNNKKQDVENQTTNNTQQQQSQLIMSKFFGHVDTIKATIDHISSSTKRIKQMDEQTKLAVSESEEKKMSLEIKRIIDGTNMKAKDGKTILSLLRDENKEYEARKVINVSDLRKRENLVNTLTRKFIDEMKEYQNAQQAYKINIRNKAEQQIKFVKEDATPEEVEEILKSDGGREGLYQQSILQGGVNESIKQTYTKVVGKYQDIQALEKSVAELHQMFLDFALLVDQQGELIDQIEFNVKSAADYVEDANEDVHQAIEYSKSVRKKQCFIIVLVIVVTLVLLFSFKIIP